LAFPSRQLWSHCRVIIWHPARRDVLQQFIDLRTDALGVNDEFFSVVESDTPSQSGGTPPQSKTQAQIGVPHDGHVLECGSALPLWDGGYSLRFLRDT